MAEKDFYDIKGLGEVPPENTVAHTAPPPEPPRPFKDPNSRRRGRKLLFALLVLVIVAGLGGGAYWFGKHTSKHKPAPKQASSSQSSTSSTSANGTQTYVSKGSDLNLSFTYPAGWTATPASGGNSNDQTITVTSPVTTITAAGGSSTNGKVAVTIRPGTASIDELDANNPSAALASTQIAFTAPTANQNQYPYITYIHFTTGASTAGAFEEVMITGPNQFTAGEIIAGGDLSGLDPIVAANFTQCTTDACTGTAAKPLSITQDTWNNSNIGQQTVALFESLKLN